MSHPDQASISNRLLRPLSVEGFARLAPGLEVIESPKGATLLRPGQPIEHAYVFENTIGSIVATSPEGRRVEAGLVGRGGFAPAPLVMESDRLPYGILVQVPDRSRRIAAARLTAACEASPALHGLLLRYAQTLAVQTSYTALSNAPCIRSRSASPTGC